MVRILSLAGAFFIGSLYLSATQARQDPGQDSDPCAGLLCWCNKGWTEVPGYCQFYCKEEFPGCITCTAPRYDPGFPNCPPLQYCQTNQCNDAKKLKNQPIRKLKPQIQKPSH